MPDGTPTIDLLDRASMDFEVTNHQLVGWHEEYVGFHCYGAEILEAEVTDTEGVTLTVNRDQLLSLFEENTVCDAEQSIAENAE